MTRSVLHTLTVFLAIARLGSAQCSEWSTFSAAAGANAQVRAFAVFDDGTGLMLYAAGQFTEVAGTIAPHVARWDGAHWSDVGGGADSAVNALAVYDDGSGPALYAGGQLTSAGGVSASFIAKWNGSSWAPLGAGLNGVVNALAVFDDGGGPALYVGGEFTQAGGAPANRIARWNGTTWSALGNGVSDAVHALAVYDSGAGSALFAGGSFAYASGVAVNGVAKWNGSAWSSLGTGVDGVVRALAVYDGGSGPELCAGGSFAFVASGASAYNVAKWNGTSWSTLGSGMGQQFDDTVWVLTVFDDGTGPGLCAGGDFWFAGFAMANNIARWRGGIWSAFGTGTSQSPVRALIAHDDGAGTALFAGGSFVSVDGVDATNVAKWRGASWQSVGGGPNPLNGSVADLCVFDDGSGSALYAGGSFTKAGTTTLNHIGKWNGTSWSPLSTGMTGGIGSTTSVRALCVYDHGTGPALYAGGNFTVAGGTPTGYMAKWNGNSWSGLGADNTQVSSLVSFDDGSGPCLFASGFYWTGQTQFARLSKWNGTTWTHFTLTGTGAGDLAVFDDGTGPALYVSGSFSSIDGTPVNNIAKWDGVSWTALPNEPGISVGALCAYDDGSGAALYAGGSLPIGGGAHASHIAKWNGTSWSEVGGGLSGGVGDLQVFNDGSGPALIASGTFTSAGGNPANHIAKWNGTVWSPLGSGIDSTAFALAVFDDGADADADLFVGGSFTSVGGTPSYYMAKWHGCGESSFCFGDGSGGTCPCANNGLPGHGCENSHATGGAILAASGAASLSADTVQLVGVGELPTALSIALQGSIAVAPVGFGDGLRCAGGNLKRLYSVNASGGAIAVPQPGGPSISARSATLGDPIPLGAKRVYQIYYRDPNLAFCPGGFNATNAVSILWGD